MHTRSTPAPLTVGKLLGRTVGMYCAHSGLFLRTVAIFYLPLALLSLFFVRNLISTTLFSLVVLPVGALVSLSITVHCADSLQGRPLAVTTAVNRGLRRLPANIVMMLAATVVYIGVAAVLATPVWVGLLNTDVPLGEIRDAFIAPPAPGDIETIDDIETIMNVLDDVLWGGLGLCLSGILLLVAQFYLSVRWIVAGTALMVEGTGPLESLRRSWNLSYALVLRTAGYLLILSIAMGLVGGLLGAVVSFGSAAVLPDHAQPLQAGLSGAVASLLSIFIIPFQVTALVLYYFDLRARKEGIDFGVVQA